VVTILYIDRCIIPCPRAAIPPAHKLLVGKALIDSIFEFLERQKKWTPGLKERFVDLLVSLSFTAQVLET
jgi:hypothetical protein